MDSVSTAAPSNPTGGFQVISGDVSTIGVDPSVLLGINSTLVSPRPAPISDSTYADSVQPRPIESAQASMEPEAIDIEAQLQGIDDAAAPNEAHLTAAPIHVMDPLSLGQTMRVTASTSPAQLVISIRDPRASPSDEVTLLAPPMRPNQTTQAHSISVSMNWKAFKIALLIVTGIVGIVAGLMQVARRN